MSGVMPVWMGLICEFVVGLQRIVGARLRSIVPLLLLVGRLFMRFGRV